MKRRCRTMEPEKKKSRRFCIGAARSGRKPLHKRRPSEEHGQRKIVEYIFVSHRKTQYLHRPRMSGKQSRRLERRNPAPALRHEGHRRLRASALAEGRPEADRFESVLRRIERHHDVPRRGTGAERHSRKGRK